MHKSVEIYIDGACHLNGRKPVELSVPVDGKTIKGEIGPKAAWSFVVKGGGLDGAYSGLVSESQDNNRAELMALLEALKWIAGYPGVQAKIHTDSVYVLDRVTGEVPFGSNLDLWDQISVLESAVSEQIVGISFIQSEDNLADKMAKQSSRALFTGKVFK